METSTNTRRLGRGIICVLALVFVASLAFGQVGNLVVSGSGTFSGSGVINVKGNINTSAASAVVDIPNGVVLNGTTTQDIGVSGQAITFASLSKTAASTATMTADITVTNAFSLSSGTFAVGTRALRLSGDPTNSATFDVSNASGRVYYSKTSGNQSTLAGTYAGSLFLDGAATHNLANDVSVATFSHTGGALTVNNNLSITGTTSSFATIADVSATKQLTIGSGEATIAALSNNQGTISAVANGGRINVTGSAVNAGSLSGGAGGLTIGTSLTNNLGGTVNNNGGALSVGTTTTNDGAIALGAGTAGFTGTVTNQSTGTITGGAGAVTFSGAFVGNGTSTATAGGGGFNFANTVALGGGTLTSSAGAIDFVDDFSMSTGTLSLTGTGSLTVQKGMTTTGGTVSFASGSTVSYTQAGAQSVYNTTYGNLTIGGSGTKTAAGAINVAGATVTLNNNLEMGANTLQITNAATTVSGSSEVRGAVERNHTYAAATDYAFNRAEVRMAFASPIGVATPITITMNPNTKPGGAGANYINRTYGVSSTVNLAANNATVQLYYLDAERIGTINEAKLGLHKYDGATLSKLGSNGGAYTRVDGSPANTIALTLVNQGLTGVTEFAITPITYATIAAGSWNAAATWGSTSDDIPGATDDAEVRHTVGMPVLVSQTIANLTITADATYSGILNVDNANFNATSITSTGNVNVSATRILTVGGAFVVNSGVSSTKTVTVNGTATLNSVTNNGTFTVDGASAQANLTGALNNNAGATLQTANSGSVTVTGADLTNAGTVTNNGSITVQ